MNNIELKDLQEKSTVTEADNVKGGSYLRYQLTNVRISSYSVSGASGD